MGRGDQLFTILGIDDMVDQLVDGWVLDTGIVAAAFEVGGLRAPHVALLIAG